MFSSQLLSEAGIISPFQRQEHGLSGRFSLAYSHTAGKRRSRNVIPGLSFPAHPQLMPAPLEPGGSWGEQRAEEQLSTPTFLCSSSAPVGRKQNCPRRVSLPVLIANFGFCGLLLLLSHIHLVQTSCPARETPLNAPWVVLSLSFPGVYSSFLPSLPPGAFANFAFSQRGHQNEKKPRG